MWSRLLSFYRLKQTIFQNIICALFVMGIFSLRWRNCLPFSGYMPALTDRDTFEVWGRYVMWAKEPFSFPMIGVIKSLAFPFQTANISHGPIALFAVFFKALSKIYAPFAEFYYLISAEIVFVFLTAFFTVLLLDEFKIKSFWLKFLGAVLTGLSFPLLYRSLSLSFEVGYFPGYVIFAYYYVRAYKVQSLKTIFWLALVFPLAVSIDDYLLLGISFMLFLAISIHCLEYFLNRTAVNRKRLLIGFSLVLGLLLSSATSYVLGNVENIKKQSGVTPMTGRYETRWAYGGGYGGGFHVADVLAVFIPPQDAEYMPAWKICGPDSYLTKMGFPLTMNNMQDGQYEGFSYVGTVALGLLLLLGILWGCSFLKGHKKYLMKHRMAIASRSYAVHELFSLPVIIGLSSFFLYILSWGYIIHIGGVRFNNVVTPSLLIAEYWSKFIWARSMGRLAIPFAFYLIIGAVIAINRYAFGDWTKNKNFFRVVVPAASVLLIALHVYEIRGYLNPPSEVVYGNEIANVFDKDDQMVIKELLGDKKALMVAPYSMVEIPWGKICYSLAFHGNLPLGGPTSTLNLILNKKHYEADSRDIVAGNIRGIVDRYGDVAIAVPGGMAEEILKRADMPLNSYRFQEQNVVILTLAK